MKLLRRNTENKPQLTPEEKLTEAKKGVGVGSSLMTLGAGGLLLGKIGNTINNAPIDPKIAEEHINKKAQKAIKKLVKKGVSEINEAKVREEVLNKLNKQGVNPEVIKRSKTAGKYLLLAGVPLTAYSLYKKSKAKKEIAANENTKKN